MAGQVISSKTNSIIILPDMNTFKMKRFWCLGNTTHKCWTKHWNMEQPVRALGR